MDFPSDQQEEEENMDSIHRIAAQHQLQDDEDYQQSNESQGEMPSSEKRDRQYIPDNSRHTLQQVQVAPRIARAAPYRGEGSSFYGQGGPPQQLNAAEYSAKKTNSNHQYTPLPSQYNNLLNKREGSGRNRYNSSSNDFRQSQYQSKQGGAVKYQSGVNQQDSTACQVQGEVSSCHPCSVTGRALNYSSLYSSNTIMYSQNVPIQVCQGTIENPNDLQHKYLRVEIEVLKQQSLTGGSKHAAQQQLTTVSTNHSNGDILYLSISDDANPLLLYLATIDLQTFLRIRREQNIFVEFSSLAEKVQALLDFCIQNGRVAQGEEGTSSAGELLNRFLSILNTNPTEDEGAAILNIYEHNDFRNLLHLRLSFKKASPEQTSSWLAKKLLMHRKLNIDLQAENYELNEQHEQDRLRISQIKQSLLALKATQNEELQRIKEDHEAQLEQAEESKLRIQDDLKRQYESQIQELTTEFEQRLTEIKNDANSLREELSKSQTTQKQLSDLITDRDQRIDELSGECEDIKSERERLSGKVDNLKDQNNEQDKKIIEFILVRDTLEKDLCKKDQKVTQLRGELENLQEAIKFSNGENEGLRQNHLMATEANRYNEQELARLNQSLAEAQQRAILLKERVNSKKAEIQSLRDEKLLLESKCTELSEQLIEESRQNERLKGELDSRNKLIESLEEKLKEDQQILYSNKNLIEYLNKTINDAQKFSFRTLVNQQKGEKHIPTSNAGQAPPSSSYMQSRFTTISPMRATNLHGGGVPRLDTQDIVQESQSNKQFLKSSKGAAQQSSSLPQEMVYVAPSANQLNLPMTQYYLSKCGNNTANNYLSFGGSKPPVHQQLRPAYSASTRQFNHNNPFSSQLERERIISEEKLKQRFDDAYTSKYQGGGGYQHQDTPALSANGRYSQQKDLTAVPIQNRESKRSNSGNRATKNEAADSVVQVLDADALQESDHDECDEMD